MFIDTHCHLDILPEKSLQIDEEIEKAKNEDVSFVVESIDSFESNFTSVELSKKYKNFVFSLVGVHPQQVQNAPKNYLEVLQKLIDKNSENIVGIGEVGVDLHYSETLLTKRVQLEIFENLIELSIKNNLPVAIHTWDSFDETFEILSKFAGRVRGVIHSFSYTKIEAKKFLEKLDFFISFTGALTYPKNHHLHEAIVNLPKEKIVFETDAPFLPPTGFRGKPNSPRFVKEVYKFAKENFGISESQIFENSKKLFGAKFVL
ncbi:MAG: TatD family hydrolase [Patescibacteria group bacterium]